MKPDEITKKFLINMLIGNFEIAIATLKQASNNLKILELNSTNREIQLIIEDLKNAIATLNKHLNNN